MLHLNQISLSYPNGHEALSHISFHLAPGEMAFLTGPCDAGKSSLLRLCALLTPWNSGTLHLDRQEIPPRHYSKNTEHRRRIGLLFSEPRLLPDRNLWRNVALPLTLAGVPHRQAQDLVNHALTRTGLNQEAKLMPQQLSFDQGMRAALARALIFEPPIVLADEPSARLDPELALAFMERLLELPKQGISLLMASHDVPLIRRVNARVLVLDRGRLSHDLPPGALQQ